MLSVSPSSGWHCELPVALTLWWLRNWVRSWIGHNAKHSFSHWKSRWQLPSAQGREMPPPDAQGCRSTHEHKRINILGIHAFVCAPVVYTRSTQIPRTHTRGLVSRTQLTEAWPKFLNFQCLRVELSLRLSVTQWSKVVAGLHHKHSHHWLYVTYIHYLPSFILFNDSHSNMQCLPVPLSHDGELKAPRYPTFPCKSNYNIYFSTVAQNEL